jgi:hypothetical protein
MIKELILMPFVFWLSKDNFRLTVLTIGFKLNRSVNLLNIEYDWNRHPSYHKYLRIDFLFFKFIKFFPTKKFPGSIL